MGVAKAKLLDQYLPMQLWVEAARTTVYVQNHTPQWVLNKKTHEEDFSGVKPKVNHLRIFGFLLYIHVPKEKRSKIDPSERKGVFVGFIDTSKAYQIYFPGFKKININKDVTFDEDLTYIRSRRLPIQEFKEYKSLVENQIDRKIKILWSYNGGYFTSK